MLIFQKYASRKAFTIVELTIVIVIIGLIIGAVLVGQDLIKAAAIRSTMSEVEKYNTSVETFRTKYNGIPGDLTSVRAVEFDFSGSADTNATGAAGLRDGNSVVEGGASGSTRLVGEIGLFWQDLSNAALISGSFTATGTTTTTGANVTAANLNSYLPRSRLRETVAHFLYASTGQHYYYLASFTTNATADVTPSNAVTPFEAKDIDEKMDDGVPTTGTVINMTNLTTADAGAAAATTVCVINSTPTTYNVSLGATGAPTAQVCQLRIRSSF
jgi:hypothetical protein